MSTTHNSTHVDGVDSQFDQLNIDSKPNKRATIGANEHEQKLSDQYAQAQHQHHRFSSIDNSSLVNNKSPCTPIPPSQRSSAGNVTPPATGHVDLTVLASTPTSKPGDGAAARDTTLPVIDPDGALDQCCDWSFIVELLGDVMNDRDQIINDMQDAIDNDDHVKYYKTAHALKGVYRQN